MEALPKTYDPTEIEPRWYRTWLEAGYFQAAALAPYRPFSMVFPPPNITGALHLGHALTASIQDILVRWQRMQGNNTLWLPGTDHAGIATQMVVEREIRERDGKTRHEIGRDRFLERVWDWKERHGSRIVEQLKLLGASLDWTRECFTMDEKRSRAVRHAFVRLFREALIYRAERLINWCPRCRTALSDLEVEPQEEPGELFHFAYPIEGGGEIVVATTRPETMLGDTAVAVHPDDDRYRALIGRKIRHPLIAREFVVVADSVLVDPQFGTGAVKVTPAHDFSDFEAGKRNALPTISILQPDGTIGAEGGPFSGLDRFDARKKVIAALTERGLDRGCTPHRIPVPHCQRCTAVVEPMLSMQWFVKTAPLAKAAIEAVERGETKFVPESWTKTYFHWMRNIQDWCISRQLWWGHRIPAWYCADGHITVEESDPKTCSTCTSNQLIQDEDVLDTWFSSGLWPLSTLGWPDESADLRTFYPTSVMETGYDILFFWVARMMMMGIHFAGKVPFHTVVLHSMIVDERGEKMSKVRGNVIDPADVVAKHGADALRFALAWLSTPAAQGRPVKLSMKRIEDARHFCTKIWNAARFALMNLEGLDADAFAEALREERSSLGLATQDRWILSRLQTTTRDVGRALGEYRFSEAVQTLHSFFWGDLCDWYIELAKPALRDTNEDPASRRRRRAAQGTLATVLDASLRLLHPFMPHVTEEIWQRLPKPDGSPQSLMVTIYPTIQESLVDIEAEKVMELLQSVVTETRSLRALYRVSPAAKLDVTLTTSDPRSLEAIKQHEALLRDLASFQTISTATDRPPRSPSTATAIAAGVEISLGVGGAVDMATEGQRLVKDLRKKTGELETVHQKLEDSAFRSRAPAEVISEWEERARALGEEVRRLREATGDVA